MKKILVAVIFALLVIAGAVIAQSSQSPTPIIKVTLQNQNPDPARAGDTTELKLQVENTGGATAQNLEVELLQDYPFTVVDETPLKELGNLYAYQSAENSNSYLTLRYHVKIDKGAIKGSQNLKLRYRYSGRSWITQTFSIDISSKEFAQIIYVDKAKIEPGKETALTFTITNIGNAPLQDMVFSWAEPNGVVLPVYSDDTKYIKYLDVGKSTEISYKVIADINAKPGLYQLDLTLSYQAIGNSTTSTIKTKAGVLVGGETDFDVAFSESTQGQTSLSVANTGNNPAISVSVKIPNQPNFGVAGSTSTIIGNLDKGDYTIVSFQITKNTRAGFGNATETAGQFRQRQQQTNATTETQQIRPNDLLVEIDYTDTTGERRSVQKTVPIQFRAATTGTTPAAAGQFQRGGQQNSFWNNRMFLIGSGIAIVIAGIILYKKKILRYKVLRAIKLRR